MRVRLNQQRLVAFLAQSRLSQNHWALKLGLSRGHWSEIVNGKHLYPSAKTRERMVEVLGIPFDELFEVETETQPWADTDFRRAIADRYLIDSELGQGGMGAVYLARDFRHGRVVALKVISPEAVSGIGVTQFLREIATVAHLQHPHILPLFDSGEAAGQPFYVMPYIRGGSLRARLKSAVRLPTADVVTLTRGIAAALQHAHEARVLHCDVKPENILLDGAHAYVMDFGIARKLHTEFLPWAQRSELDLSAGTPAYVSPEQANGEKDLDTRTDVYSLACVVYEMLTGRAPFEGTTTEAVVARRFFASPPPVRDFAPEVPPELDHAVERGLALDPRKRTATPADFAADLATASRPATGFDRVSIAFTRAASRLRRSARGVTIPFGSVAMETFIQDLRHAFRALKNSRAFATVVALTLALGIGANTAIFSVVRGVLLKPLPNRNGDQLVYLRHSSDQSNNLNFSVPEVRDFRTSAPSFAQIAEYSPFSVIMRTEHDAMRLQVGLVTGNYFEVMGLGPILGRVTRPSDDGPGVAPVMVLTHDFWQNRFHGDSSIVGKMVRVNGKAAEVIGVLQPAPFFPLRMDVLMNMVISPHHIGAVMQEDRRHRMTEVVARLAPGVTFDHAKAEVATVYARLEKQYPDAYGSAYHYRAELIPYKKALGQDAQLTLWLLMAAAGFVLIIAVANVTNLTMMRRVRRDQELLVRSALGAGVGRLRRLVLTENLVLGFAGAAVGTVIAIAGVPLLASLANRYSARANEIHLDGPVLAFTLAIALVVALVLSFATSMPRQEELASVSSGGRRAVGSRRRQRLQRALVVVQVAVSVVLLAGAGLLTRTMIRLSEVPTGLRTEQLLTMNVNILTRAEMNQDTGSAERTRALFATMREQIAGLPGVVSVSTGQLPLTSFGGGFDFKVDGRPLAPGAAAPTAEARAAGPGYFTSLGIPLLKGREFQSTDIDVNVPDRGAGYVAIVNQAFADRVFPGENPIGHRFAQTNKLKIDTTSDQWFRIVGVVGNTRDQGLDVDPTPEFYYPQIDQVAGGGLVVRARSNVEALARPVTQIIRKLAPSAVVENVRTIADIRDEQVAPRRLNAMLISSFGLLALLIAAVGIAGVLAFAVSARTNEIGIRMSLGADSARIQRMILTEGGILVALGLLAGGALALESTNAIRDLLYGIAPHDPVTFAGVAVLMGVIGVAACWIPAARAARIDPAITMRAEQ
ncbi:MAG TPA: ADOP family duplicated permease [Gemmatimonadaceae bacterium]|nr:ADOP family duplicated permease [Gemmatimonadaceae bacterium]